MLFSSALLGQTLIWTLLTVVAVAAFRFVAGRKFEGRTLAALGAGAFVLNLISFYFFMPAHVGSLDGYEFQLLVLFAAVAGAQGLAMLRADNRNRDRWGDRTKESGSDPDARLKPLILVLSAAAVVLIAYPLVQLGVHTRFGSDPKDWAAQANI